jgi:hypothetical protein
MKQYLKQVLTNLICKKKQSYQVFHFRHVFGVEKVDSISRRKGQFFGLDKFQIKFLLYLANKKHAIVETGFIFIH